MHCRAPPTRTRINSTDYYLGLGALPCAPTRTPINSYTLILVSILRTTILVWVHCRAPLLATRINSTDYYLGLGARPCAPTRTRINSTDYYLGLGARPCAPTRTPINSYTLILVSILRTTILVWAHCRAPLLVHLSTLRTPNSIHSTNSNLQRRHFYVIEFAAVVLHVFYFLFQRVENCMGKIDALKFLGTAKATGGKDVNLHQLLANNV